MSVKPRDPWFWQRWAHEQRVGNPTRKLILMAIAVRAEVKTGECFASQADLAFDAECSDRTVRDQIKILEAAGLVTRCRRNNRDGSRAPDGFQLIALTEESAAREAGPTGSTASVLPEAAASGEQPLNDHRVRANALTQREKVKTTTVDQDQLPDDLPLEGVVLAGKILDRLRALQLQRGGNSPTRRGVGLALQTFPDRDHLAVLCELEHWALAGRGQAKPVKDWVGTFRTFLKRTPAGTQPIVRGAAASIQAPIHNLTDEQEQAAELQRCIERNEWQEQRRLERLATQEAAA